MAPSEHCQQIDLKTKCKDGSNGLHLFDKKCGRNSLLSCNKTNLNYGLTNGVPIQSADARQLIILECLMCFKKVSSKNLVNHLWFGSVECVNCNFRTSSCEKFKSRNEKCIKYSCKHKNLRWEQPYRSNFLACNTTSKFIQTYLKDTAILKHTLPWCQGYQKLENFLEESEKKLLKEYGNEQLDCVNSSTTDIESKSTYVAVTHPQSESVVDKANHYHREYLQTEVTFKASSKQPSSAARNNRGTHCVSKKRTSYKDTSQKHEKHSLQSDKYRRVSITSNDHLLTSDDCTYNLNVPEDDHYLIMKEPTDDCPECHNEFLFSRVTFDLINGLITYECPKCRLTIFFVITPPNKKPLVHIQLRESKF